MTEFKRFGGMSLEEKEEPTENIAIYKAVKGDNYGVSENGEVYVGLKLEYQPESVGYDPLKEQIECIGNEGSIIMPDGIEEGKLYIVKICNISRDYESGVIDDWDVSLKKYTQEEE